MKLRTLAAVAALSVSMSGLLAGAALAEGRVAVTLEAPLAAKTKVVAGGAVFVCEDKACVAATAPGRAVTTASCKVLVKEVGRVSAFAAPDKSLGAEELERCNAAAKAA